MPPPIPPSIEEYITNKQRDSLSLITSTSGASANWLVIRQLWAALRVRHRRTPNDALSLPTDSSAVASDDPHTVILVSWMRDLEFWKLESKRALGLDLSQSTKDGCFVYVDGLSSLYSPSPGPALATAPIETRPAARMLRVHTPQALSSRQSPASSNPSPPSANKSTTPNPTLTSPLLPHVLTILVTELENLRNAIGETRPTLILDMPGVLLFQDPPISATDLNNFILALRRYAHNVIVTLPADEPLLSASLDNTASQTPLEVESAAFAVGIAHEADVVMSCRTLGSGWAADVSGTIRVTRGGGYEHDEEVKDGEWLYHVGGDGGVKVWDRGSGDM